MPLSSARESSTIDIVVLRVQSAGAPERKIRCFWMKKGMVLKGLLAVLFVFAAGIFYICVAGKEDGGGLILQQQGQKNLAQGDGLPTGEDAGGLLVEPDKEEASTWLYVHVCGAVKEPGVYALLEGSRIADAIVCAGDFLPGAAHDYLNLAQPVCDGQKIYVPSQEEADRQKEAFSGILPDGEGETKDTPYVNINTAASNELMELPGIGKSKADAIVAYRKEHGAFSSCEDLMQVPGIKESVYEKLRDVITVGR